MTMVLVSVAVAAVAAACSSSGQSQGGSGKLPKSITFAAVQDLTGVAWMPGTDTSYGMDTAVQESNATHFLGVDTNLSIDYQDTGTVPANWASAFGSAVAKTYAVILGSVSSNIAIVE